MHASPTEIDIDHLPDEAPPTREADAAVHALAREIGHGLQLSRGTALALTRLQLALKTGDRHAAMAAMDRLHAIDTEMEQLTARLPTPAEGDPDAPDWNLIARQLGDQKTALAFEKLALVSGVSGPDMVSQAQQPYADEPAPEHEPTPRDSAPDIARHAFGLVLALAAMAVIIAAAMVMTGGI